MQLSNEFDELIQALLKINTSNAIDDLARNIYAVSCITENMLKNNIFEQMKDPKFQVLGIALLAVDDAKTQEHPSSANPIYRAVFDRAKELMQQT